MANAHSACGFVAIGLFVASCAVSPVAFEPGRVADTAQISLAPSNFAQLPGWSNDNIALALSTFVKSCDRLAPQAPDSAPLDASATGPILARCATGGRCAIRQ